MRSRDGAAWTMVLGMACLPSSGCAASGAPTGDQGDEEPDDDEVDAGTTSPPDAGEQPDAEPEVEVSDCTVTSTLGAVGTLAGDAAVALQDGSTDQVYRLLAPLADGEPADVLAIELWQGYGAFASGPIAPGDYPLTEADAAPATCGACVYLAGDATDAGVAAYYIATSGVLHVSSVAGTLTVALEAATFAEFDPETGLPIDDGCAATLDSAFVSGAIEVTPVDSCDRRCDATGSLPGAGGVACYCDDLCASSGDCCGGAADREAACGEPDAAASCAGWCGYDGALDGPGGACYCDDACVASGDCCGGAAAFEAACQDAGPAPDSCEGSCGGQAPSGCFCDLLCVLGGDCCADAFDVCF